MADFLLALQCYWVFFLFFFLVRFILSLGFLFFNNFSYLVLWFVLFHSLISHSSKVFFLICWSILDLQCCINFCYTAKWFSYTYIHILFHILFYCGVSQHIEYSFLCYMVGSTLLFIHSMCNSLHLLIPNSQSIPLLPTPAPPYPLPWQSHKSVFYVFESVSVM